MTNVRLRVAALIERDGQLLVAKERARGQSGRHDGELYLTPPGGGIEAGETPVAAVTREVREETGLVVTRAEYVSQIEHPGAITTLFRTWVEPGKPIVGVDPEDTCDCPRLVGLEWIDAPPMSVWTGPDARSALSIPHSSAR